MYDVDIETAYLEQSRREALDCLNRLKQAANDLIETVNTAGNRLEGRQYSTMEDLANQAWNTVTVSADNLQDTADCMMRMENDLEQYLGCLYREA